MTIRIREMRRRRRRRKKIGAEAAGLRARQDYLPQGDAALFCLERKTQEQCSRENGPDRRMDGEMEGKTDRRWEGQAVEGRAKVGNKENKRSPEGSWEVQVDLSGRADRMMKRYKGKE